MQKTSLGFLEGMLVGAMQPTAADGMKYMDWEKAKQICVEHPQSTIYAGLCEDWEYTSGLIFKNGEFVWDYVYDQSRWATPVLEVDGEMIECWTHEPHEDTGLPAWWPAQEEEE